LHFNIEFGDDRKKFYERYNHYIHIQLIDLLALNDAIENDDPPVEDVALDEEGIGVIYGLVLQNPTHQDIIKDIHAMLRRELNLPTDDVDYMLDIDLQEHVSRTIWDLFSTFVTRYVKEVQKPIHEYFQIYYYETEH
jgi:hypothetical protein